MKYMNTTIGKQIHLLVAQKYKAIMTYCAKTLPNRTRDNLFHPHIYEICNFVQFYPFKKNTQLMLTAKKGKGKKKKRIKKEIIDKTETKKALESSILIKVI